MGRFLELDGTQAILNQGCDILCRCVRVFCTAQPVQRCLLESKVIVTSICCQAELLKFRSIEASLRLLRQAEQGEKAMDLVQAHTVLSKARHPQQPAYVPSIFALGGRGYYENPTTDLLAFFAGPQGATWLRRLFPARPAWLCLPAPAA
ncbi:hypothetical protein [Pseudomonas aegrilactucae]|uniref:Uncharacterized protein n=1 Tax=Pseudomonas aegrilactucae TaxID=2854028 RepID=A0A9Q2XJZ1_9PSED|nr:hypothetical protein [Pseudomonas aegrilactucae]MBV6287694.1 hypothetical protein [Pseudomonas aegrilactucae]